MGPNLVNLVWTPQPSRYFKQRRRLFRIPWPLGLLGRARRCIIPVAFGGPFLNDLGRHGPGKWIAGDGSSQFHGPARFAEVNVLEPASAPKLMIDGISCRSTEQPGRWNIVWRINNLGDTRAEIGAAWLPHDRFFSENREFNPPLLVDSLGSADLEIPVDCQEPPGATIENAFVILRLAYNLREWRVFARQEVYINSQGVPHATCRSVTCQLAGNSGSAGPKDS